MKVNEIARAVEIYPAQLSREFGRFFKITSGEYLRQLRIESATKQLEQTDMTLSDIATANGFADQAHFSRAFRRPIKLSPAQQQRLVKPLREK